MIRTGLDRLLASAGELAGREYAVCSHAAAVTVDLVPIHLALSRSVAGPPGLLLAPEHGLYGVEQDMVASAERRDPWTRAPIVSLYDGSEESLRPDPAVFDGVDLLIVDFQDVGSRYYTYAATALWATEVALASGCEVWILDRPNPLGGEVIEGNRPRQGFSSFVGAFDLPVRHGLTLAELLRWGLERSSVDTSGVRFWELEGWQRAMTWEQCGRPWLAPSPNLPTVSAVRVYPGACLLEATNVSEGRGTTRPFELIGSPGLDAVALAARLSRLGLEGCRFVPTLFKPGFQKHAGRICAGVAWLVEERASLAALRCGVEILRALRDLDPGFEWRRDPYEFVAERPAIDLLTGSDELRLALDADAGVDEWMASWREDESWFAQARREILFYPDVQREGT